MDRQAWDTLFEQIKALEAKMAAQPYFEQIAQRCREVVQRRGEDV